MLRLVTSSSGAGEEALDLLWQSFGSSSSLSSALKSKDLSRDSCASLICSLKNETRGFFERSFEGVEEAIGTAGAETAVEEVSVRETTAKGADVGAALGSFGADMGLAATGVVAV